MNKFLALLFLTFVFMPGSASAQKIIDQFKKPLPEVAAMKTEDFRAATKTIKDKPGGDPDLEYLMRLPKDWERAEVSGSDQFSLTERVLSDVAKFYSPAPASALGGGQDIAAAARETQSWLSRGTSLVDRSYLLIRVSKPGHTITAHDWLIQYLLANKFNFRGMAAYDDSHAEVLYVKLDNNVSYVVRGVVYINGGKVIFAEYYMPYEKWEESKVLQAQVMDSFVMKNPREGDSEIINTHQFLDVDQVRYPQSWTLKVMPIRSVERMQAKLFNFGIAIENEKETQKLNGRIDVDLISVFVAEALENETDRHRQTLADQGLILGAQIEKPEDLVYNPNFDFAETTVYESNDQTHKLVDYEFWITVASMGDYYYFITLLTPSRDGDYFLWAKNKQHYKIVVNSISPRTDLKKGQD
ncbi:MAG: hypothetical protein IT559_00910 [Alphaproteobacteria bacterium]|nr:hypothetical protein [Alphaproteobacteria bacterium]